MVAERTVINVLPIQILVCVLPAFGLLEDDWRAALSWAPDALKQRAKRAVAQARICAGMDVGDEAGP